MQSLRRQIRIALLSIGLVAFSTAALAQRYSFQPYAEASGLGSLAINAITQDSQGFIWVGTEDGLYRYDGDRFEKFAVKDGLASQLVSGLYPNPDGSLWVATLRGLSLYRNHKFTTFTDKFYLDLSPLYGISDDGAGKLYLTGRGLSVAEMPAAGQQLQPRPVAMPPTITDPFTTAVLAQAGGAVWFGCGKSLCRTIGGQTRVYGVADGVPEDRWAALLLDREGGLWARSRRELIVLHAGAKQFASESDSVRPLHAAYPSLGMDRDGRILVPTSSGLFIRSAGKWRVITRRNGLPLSEVTAVFRDREESLWIGTNGAGLFRWLGYDEWESYTESEGLSGDRITEIGGSPEQGMWVGTASGLSIGVRVNRKMEWRTVPLEGAGGECNFSLAPDGTLWIISDPNRITHYDPRTRQTRQFGPFRLRRGNKMELQEFRGLKADSAGNLWLTTANSGSATVFRVRAGDATFQLEDMQPPCSDKGCRSFNSFAETRDGAMWVTSWAGLYRYAEKKWAHFGMRDGLQSDFTSTLSVSPAGQMWLCYRDNVGASRLWFQDGKLKVDPFNQQSGLGSSRVSSVGFDNKGRPWLMTDKGVDIRDGSRWIHYDRSDGLTWDDCTGSFLGEHDGSAWIGTSRGLAYFRPSARPQTFSLPNPVLTEVFIGKNRVDLSSPLTRPVIDDTLEVRFSSLNYRRESTVKFNYRLYGLNEAFRQTTKRELAFSPLPPGKYRFELTAGNTAEQWSAEPVTFSFELAAPWHRSIWFKLLIVLILTGLGGLYARMRWHRAAQARRMLEHKVAERTVELREEKARVEQQHRRIEQLLEQTLAASRMKTQFLSNMSHEIRTPMNGILGMTNLALNTSLNGEQRECLETVRFSAESLLSLLNEILDFSKIEAGKLDLHVVTYSVRELVRGSCALLSARAAEKKLLLSWSVESGVPDRVKGDDGRLRQILLNLLGNAIKFTEHGSVRLDVSWDLNSAQDLYLQFRVTDTGIGIAEDKLSLIFEDFRQADGSVSRQYGGSGLGLAICSRLSTMLGGRIWVQSEPGKGSEFSFTIRVEPVPDEAILTAPPEATVPSAAPARMLRVLVAEDNAINLKLAQRILQKRGHEVLSAVDGRAAVELWQQETVDAILMDIQMPEVDGIEATRRIRKLEAARGGRVPILAITANAMKEDEELCLEAGMDGFITKPFNPQALLAEVERLATEAPVKARL